MKANITEVEADRLKIVIEGLSEAGLRGIAMGALGVVKKGLWITPLRFKEFIEDGRLFDETMKVRRAQERGGDSIGGPTGQD